MRELHRFFQDWFTGEIEDTGASFRRLADALAPEFRMIAPDGRRVERSALLEGVREAHGSRDPTAYRIRVDGFEGRPLGPDHHLVLYEEWQEDGRDERGRLSSAVFRRRKEAPTGVEWVHLHEVWTS